MIDVLLVLLIIFMAIAPQRATGLDVLVPPSASAGDDRIVENSIVLEIDSTGSYRLNSQSVTAAELTGRLTRAYASRANRVLFIKGAPDLEFSTVATAMDRARAAKIDRLALIPR